MRRQPKKQSIQKSFLSCQIFCRAYVDGHFGRKPFRVSLRNDNVIVKTLNKLGMQFFSDK
jgi:hypothetical protein